MRPPNFTKIIPLHIPVPDGFPLGAVICLDSSVGTEGEDEGVIYAILSSTQETLRWIRDNDIPQSPQGTYFRAPLYRGHDALTLYTLLSVELQLEQIEGRYKWLLENRESLKEALEKEE